MAQGVIRWTLVAVWWAGAPLSGQTPGAGTPASRDLDVPYVADADPEQHLDFYWPGGAPTATVLFVHGGSLRESGERRHSPAYADVCAPFVAAGVACATTDYRLAPSVQWPTMPLDVSAAVAKVRELVSARGGDPARLFLFGHSSGCTIVSSLGVNPEYLGSVGLAPSDVAGVIAMGCVLDNQDAALRGLTADDLRPRFERSGSYDRFASPEDWIGANPSYHVGSHAAPFRVVVAREERFHPSILEQGARFVRRLIEADVPADLVIVPGTHMSSIAAIDDPDDPTLATILDFIRDPSAGAS